MTDTAQPVAALLAAVYARLNVAAVTALATGGVYNDLPQSPTYPCVRLWARAKPLGGLADHRVWQADVEVWIYSTYAGDKDALAIAEQVCALLHYQPLPMSGWSAVIVALEDEYRAGDEDLNGVQVRSWVLAFHLYLEQA